MNISSFADVDFGLVHINHASLLIKHKDNYLLTDPWYISPAFSSWTQSPSPPSDLIKFILSRDRKKLSIVASHGHDDHVDDWFIRQHLQECAFYIPAFRSPGLRRRAQSLVQSEPIELTDEPSNGEFRLSRFINDDFTSFDSLISIETEEFTVLHANDNWHALPDEIIAPLKAIKGRATGPFYYFCQLGIADCYPHCYPQYTDDEVVSVSRSRLLNNIHAAETNMRSLGLTQLYSYANQSRIISEYSRPNFNGQKLLEDLLSDRTRSDLHITQMTPGTWLDLTKSPAKEPPRLDVGADILRYCIKRLEAAAASYFEKTDKSGPVRFEITEEFDPQGMKSGIVYSTNAITWQRILTGAVNLETISIGGGGSIFREPRDISIRDVHIQVGNFGYIAQRNFRAQGLNWLLD